jgi:hypothetical protein
MGYRRIITPLTLWEGEQLSSAMVGIGMNLAAAPMRDANIEDTLLAASVEALENEKRRTLAILMTWFGIHATWVNADRLYRIVKTQDSSLLHAFWSALARWKGKDRRFSKMARLHQGPPRELLSKGTAFHLSRHGEDPRLANGPLIVPANVLRDRPRDVLSPGDLATRHRDYRQRIIMGPTYRADMWALLRDEPHLSAAELARRTYGSFATAWQVKRDWDLLAA